MSYEDLKTPYKKFIEVVPLIQTELNIIMYSVFSVNLLILLMAQE